MVPMRDFVGKRGLSRINESSTSARFESALLIDYNESVFLIGMLKVIGDAVLGHEA